jgi:glycosyltransferase involved in cell wall biosynthesis
MATASVCAIMKDEAPYLLEWIAFHKVIGFDRVVIYDNDSTDRTAELLEELNRVGEIIHVPWPSVSGVAPQRAAYADALGRAGSEWIAFLDADEFLNLQQDNSVGGFLARFPPGVSAVAMNWRIFGSSGHQTAEPGLVTDRFLRASRRSVHLNRHLKTIARVSDVTEMHVHRCFLRQGRYVNDMGIDVEIERLGFTGTVSHQLVQINHYVVKSREEFRLKKARGNANRAIDAVDKFTRVDESFFEKHDINDELDESIRRFRPALLQEMARLRATAGLPGTATGL